MATFLTIGQKTINVDLVFEIDDYGDRMRIFYAVTSSDTTGARQPAYAEIEGEAAAGLRRWLAERAEVIDVAEQPVVQDAGEASAAAVGANAQSVSRTGYEPAAAEGYGAIFDPRHET